MFDLLLITQINGVLSHYLSKNLIITNFTIHLKLRLDVQAPPLSQNYNSTGRLFQIEIHLSYRDVEELLSIRGVKGRSFNYSEMDL